jgi:hypothetical protein
VCNIQRPPAEVVLPGEEFTSQGLQGRHLFAGESEAVLCEALLAAPVPPSPLSGLLLAASLPMLLTQTCGTGAEDPLTLITA